MANPTRDSCAGGMIEFERTPFVIGGKEVEISRLYHDKFFDTYYVRRHDVGSDGYHTRVVKFGDLPDKVKVQWEEEII